MYVCASFFVVVSKPFRSQRTFFSSLYRLVTPPSRYLDPSIYLFLSIPSSSPFLSVFSSLEAHSFSISLTPFLAVNFQCETISKYITIIQSLFSDYYCFCLYRIYFILFYFILSSTFLTVRWQFDDDNNRRRKTNKQTNEQASEWGSEQAKTISWTKTKDIAQMDQITIIMWAHSFAKAHSQWKR